MRTLQAKQYHYVVGGQRYEITIRAQDNSDNNIINIRHTVEVLDPAYQQEAFDYIEAVSGIQPGEFSTEITTKLFKSDKINSSISWQQIN